MKDPKELHAVRVLAAQKEPDIIVHHTGGWIDF